MKPTYEELEAKVQRIEELLKQALEKIAQLEEQLKRNSKNSSKPPSTDQKNNTPDIDKKPPRDSRTGKARPSFPPDKIDRYVQCKQKNCPHCGSSKIQLNRNPPEILQQAELPEIKAVITEFQLQKYHCEKLCGTLLEDFDKLWTFTRILEMEPTNNMAERDLRRLVIWRKKSYGTRSNRGKKFFERITTVAQTIRKQGGNVLRFIQEAIECFYSQALPPLISEAMGF